MPLDPPIATALRRGLVVSACPLALDARRRLGGRRQRALVRYCLDAGAGGLAFGVHTTQFAIRDPRDGLFEPVLRPAAEEIDRAGPSAVVRIAGVCGRTAQAEAALKGAGADEGLSPGQAEEIDRVSRPSPHLADDDFVRENLDCWLRG